MRTLIYLFTLLFLGGCAMGNSTSYQGRSNFTIDYEMPSVAFGVIDHRPYVLDGSKSNTYTGTMRSVGGVPYNMNTKSGLPLSQALQGMIGNTLAYNGIAVDNSVVIPPTATEEEAIKLLVEDGKPALLLTLNEWMSHIYFNPIWAYDLKLISTDKEGHVLAKSMRKGEIEFSQNQEVKSLADAITIAMQDVFNDEATKLALTTGKVQKQLAVAKEEKTQETVLPEVDNQKCSTEQILKMKEMGMADTQIKAACGS